jgi:predicted transcriptional regulator
MPEQYPDCQAVPRYREANMVRVGDIMTPHVVTLAAEATLREAIETLVTCRIGGAPVVEGEQIVGVLSAPDILEFESVTPIAADVHDWPPAVTVDEIVPESEETDAAPAFFTDHWSDSDASVAGRFESTTGPEWDFLNDHLVSEAMTRSVCVLPARLEVSAAAQQMLAAGVQRAIIVKSGKLMGILTATDILRAVAERRLTTRQFVFG